MGNYSYASGRPNAVTGVTNPQNVIPNAGQNINYTAFSQPATVTENGYELTYTYGADYNRIRSITKQNGNEINRRYYFGEYEKDITGGTTRHLHYISSPAGLVAIVVRENGNDTYYYTYTDHLGSILTVTNSGGGIVAEQSFDAWGRYRDVNTWSATTTAPSGGVWAWLTRGYTGHEHLRPFALINMNGRLYDPALGRVLSPDNYVQDPFFTQNYNRYSYAYNNPLVYNDPDGQLVFLAAVAIGAAVGVLTNGINNSINGVSFFQGAGKAAFIGAISGAFSFGIGQAAMGMSGVAKVGFQTLFHGHFGGVMSSMNGGTYGQGFLSGEQVL